VSRINLTSCDDVSKRRSRLGEFGLRLGSVALFVSRNDWPQSDWETIFGSVEAAEGIKINGSVLSFNNSLGFNQ